MKHSWLARVIWSALFAMTFAIGLATLLAVVMGVWEWVENPGGIFRDESGTNWGFVFDTTVSWFIPTMGWAFLAAFIFRLSAFVLLAFRVRPGRPTMTNGEAGD